MDVDRYLNKPNDGTKVVIIGKYLDDPFWSYIAGPTDRDKAEDIRENLQPGWRDVCSYVPTFTNLDYIHKDLVDFNSRIMCGDPICEVMVMFHDVFGVAPKDVDTIKQLWLNRWHLAGMHTMEWLDEVLYGKA